MKRPCPPPPDPWRIGYVVWRFPKLSESFILREMNELERLGWHIDVFRYTCPDEPVLRPEAERWVARLDRLDTIRHVVRANLAWLREDPLRLLGLYALVAGALWSEPRELGRGLLAAAYAALWARRARARGICHVHAHFARHPAVAALAMAHLTGITFSFTGHAQDIYHHPDMLRTKVRRARFVVVISRLLRDRYVRPLVATRDLAHVHVVRCGVETETYQAIQRRDLHGPPRVLTVARLVEGKGLAILIEACRLLKQRGCDVRCQIIGDGPLRDELEQQIAALGLAEYVTLRGACPEADVQRAREEASIFVLPSIITGDRMEGVPVSLMEAMANGIAVISTRTGGIPELVVDGETGVLVDPGDAEGLACAIERLAVDRAWAHQLAEAGQRHVAAEFDLHSNVYALHRLLLAPSAPGDARVSEALPLVGARSLNV